MGLVSRREFLKRCGLCAAGAVVWGAVPGLGMATARAAAGNGTKILFVNLNGGLDGLAALQPISGQTYSTLRTLRPTLALDPSALLPGDSNYAFHPTLTQMKSLYDAGDLAAVLNVGYDNMSRSHLDAEVAMARGVGDRLRASSSGFVNRMGAAYGWSSLQAVSVSGADRSFEGGDYQGVQVTGLSNFYFKWDETQSASENTYRRDMLYSLSQDAVVEEGKSRQGKVIDGLDLAVNNSDTVRQALQQTTFPNAYPNTRMGGQFKDIDILFSSSAFNTEIGYLRASGYDTHSHQATVLTSNLTDFNAALGVFVANMKARGLWNNLIIVVFSEFGRTNKENGSNGTDHGGANPFFLIGGPVSGGIVGTQTSSDLTSGGWLSMKVNVVEIYRQLTTRMGYDADRVFETPSQQVLPALFA